jgi:hypothetical protein
MILKLGRSPCSVCDQSPDWDGMGWATWLSSCTRNARFRRVEKEWPGAFLARRVPTMKGVK